MKWSPISFGSLTFWSPRNLVPEKFGPQEVWALRNLGSKKFELCMKIITWLFRAGPKLLRAQISWRPNFSGPKFLEVQISWGPKKSGAQIRSGTISVIAKEVSKSYSNIILFSLRGKKGKTKSKNRSN